jgi:transposase
MPFITYKKFGKQEYTYQQTSYRDPQTNKPKHKQKYLGVVIDKEKHIYEKRRKNTQQTKQQQEKQILDYGDTYLLHEITKTLPIYPILKTTFKDQHDTLMTLILHRITNSGTAAMRYTENYYNGNYIQHLYPDAQITSQDISKFLTYLGKEDTQKSFFSTYIHIVCKGKPSVVIDSTGLPNEINMSVTDWGYHNGGIEYETRLILAVDQTSKMPLYFRYVAGNVGDVSTLANTIVEMKKHGISTSSALIDAGYYSEANLKLLFDAGISFLIRMPSNLVLYRSVVAQCVDIESSRYVVKFGKRGLFVKEVEVEVCGGRGAFGYLVLDPERRGREISRAVLDMDEEKVGGGGGGVDFVNCGKMVLLSSVRLSTVEVVPLYYMRQVVERMFGVAKDDLGILPLRTHGEPNFKGFMLLIFVSLIVYCGIKDRLGNKVPMEQVVSLLKNLKCKVFDNSIIPCEVTKQQRLLFETLDIVVPKTCGI